MKNREYFLKSALYNLVPGSGASDDYNRGLVVGVVSCLMGYNCGFYTAIEIVKENLPADYRLTGIPDSWQEYFEKG